MSSLVHSTAVVHPSAKVDPSTEVGAYAVIDADVAVGPNCLIGPHVHLTGHTVIGAGNRFHAGCVIGDAPQDLRYKNEPTRTRIGDRNVFREHVTVHRSNKVTEETVIGSDCLLMAGAHVGHNSVLGDSVIMANGSLLGGHVSVGDRVFISGNTVVHQFVRIGMLAMLQGISGCGQDVPPFTILTGVNRICGLNAVGMRRAGFTSEERLELKRLYHFLFRSGQNLRSAIPAARTLFPGAKSGVMLDFLADSKRGVCRDRSKAGSTRSEGE